MDAIEFVLNEQRLGRRVTLCRDCYGNHWADVANGFLRPTHLKYELSREEYDWLRVKLRTHVRGANGAGGVRTRFGVGSLLG
jgi:hypothetical protein